VPQAAATGPTAYGRLRRLHNLWNSCVPQVDYLDTTSCVRSPGRVARPGIRDDFRSFM